MIEPWDFARSEKRIAQKEHRCFWCHEPIEVGWEYRVTHGVLDGRWHTQKWCRRCQLYEPEPGKAVRPEDAVRELREAVSRETYGGVAYYCTWEDPRVIRLSGIGFRASGTRSATYEAILVPGRGITEWTEVGR